MLYICVCVCAYSAVTTYTILIFYYLSQDTDTNLLASNVQQKVLNFGCFCWASS
jgi:hypothetical protein